MSSGPASVTRVRGSERRVLVDLGSEVWPCAAKVELVFSGVREPLTPDPIVTRWYGGHSDDPAAIREFVGWLEDALLIADELFRFSRPLDATRSHVGRAAHTVPDYLLCAFLIAHGQHATYERGRSGEGYVGFHDLGGLRLAAIAIAKEGATR